jgi:hypothetical protein
VNATHQESVVLEANDTIFLVKDRHGSLGATELDARWLEIDAEEVAAITQKFPNWAFERPEFERFLLPPESLGGSRDRRGIHRYVH